MPVSGAQHASVHEMLQAAVHSMYSRDGSGPASTGRTAGALVLLRAAASAGSRRRTSIRRRSDPARSVGDRSARSRRRAPTRVARVAEHALAVRIGAAADEAAVAEHHQRVPRPACTGSGWRGSSGTRSRIVILLLRQLLHVGLELVVLVLDGVEEQALGQVGRAARRRPSARSDAGSPSPCPRTSARARAWRSLPGRAPP